MNRLALSALALRVHNRWLVLAVPWSRRIFSLPGL